MLRFIRLVSTSALIALAAIALVSFTTSREESVLAAIYQTLFGAPDLGPVDFETFSRSTRPNTALACPADLCRNAKADFDPGIFLLSDEDLRKRFTAFVLAQPRVIPVYRHERPGLPTQDRYIQRSEKMSFPDTIDVRFIALSDTTSTLAIYSRSQLGYRDFGVNLARIRLWTGEAMTKAGN